MTVSTKTKAPDFETVSSVTIDYDTDVDVKITAQELEAEGWVYVGVSPKRGAHAIHDDPENLMFISELMEQIERLSVHIDQIQIEKFRTRFFDLRVKHGWFLVGGSAR